MLGIFSLLRGLYNKELIELQREYGINFHSSFAICARENIARLVLKLSSRIIARR